MKNDCISREAVLESIKNLYPDMPIVDIMGARRKWLDKYAPYFECENVVERLPSVTPAPKMGHWIYDDDVLSYEGHFGAYTCSCCNKTFLDDLCMNNGSDEINVGNEFKYCPFCGAKLSEIPTGSESEG